MKLDAICHMRGHSLDTQQFITTLNDLDLAYVLNPIITIGEQERKWRNLRVQAEDACWVVQHWINSNYSYDLLVENHTIQTWKQRGFSIWRHVLGHARAHVLGASQIRSGRRHFRAMFRVYYAGASAMDRAFALITLTGFRFVRKRKRVVSPFVGVANLFDHYLPFSNVRTHGVAAAAVLRDQNTYRKTNYGLRVGRKAGTLPHIRLSRF